MRRCALVLIAVLASACGAETATTTPTAGPTPAVLAEDSPSAAPEASDATPATSAETERAGSGSGPSPTSEVEASHPATPSVPARPAWLGTRVLEAGPDGSVPPQPTPSELDDRRLPPSFEVDLPAPASDAYASAVSEVPAEVLARSTWDEACPVAADDLRYVTVTYWGFDGRHHTGELLVNAAVASDLAAVFERLHAARFPLEEVRIVAVEELDLPPTGDGNVTTAFVCRPARGTTSWSQHAYGLAVDLNPFHNPYLRGAAATTGEALSGDAIVLPELATSYVDRDRLRPGMIVAGDVVTTAFREIGWGWGGDWRSLKDWMHFSADGS